MHNVWLRGNALFCMALTTLGLMCAATTLSTYFNDSNNSKDSKYSSMQNLNLNSNSDEILKTLEIKTLEGFSAYKDHTDRAIFSFDLSVNLKQKFNWNVKQLFVFVVAEYISTSNHVNEIIIYDTILVNTLEGEKSENDILSLAFWQHQSFFSKSKKDQRSDKRSEKSRKKARQKRRSVELVDSRVKYFLADMHHELRNTEVTLKLYWDTMPICGSIYVDSLPSPKHTLPYVMPTVYKTDSPPRRQM